MSTSSQSLLAQACALVMADEEHMRQLRTPSPARAACIAHTALKPLATVGVLAKSDSEAQSVDASLQADAGNNHAAEGDVLLPLSELGTDSQRIKSQMELALHKKYTAELAESCTSSSALEGGGIWVDVPNWRGTTPQAWSESEPNVQEEEEHGPRAQVLQLEQSQDSPSGGHLLLASQNLHVLTHVGYMDSSCLHTDHGMLYEVVACNCMGLQAQLMFKPDSECPPQMWTAAIMHRCINCQLYHRYLWTL